MIMIRLLTIFLVIVLATISACQKHVPARFISPTTESLRLTSHSGIITVAQGLELSKDGDMVGSERNLLHMLVVWPKKHFRLTDGAIQHDVNSNVYSWRWGEGEDSVSSKIIWNRVEDLISIGTNSFQRSKGSVIVAINWRDKPPEIIQLGSASTDLRPKAVLEFVKSELNEHSIIQALSLPN